MSKANVLFICVHNSARSRMAEALLDARCGEFFAAQSAGLDPGPGVNPLAAEVMREIGLDITQAPAQAVFDVWTHGPIFEYVITVCSESDAAGCPIFPGPAKRLHWPFDDPSTFTGTWEEKLARTREVREQIARQIEAFCVDACRA